MTNEQTEAALAKRFTDNRSIFHNFILINHKTGSRMPITQIGATREAAEKLIREHNLAAFAEAEWAVRELVYVTPEETALAEKYNLPLANVSSTRDARTEEEERENEHADVAMKAARDFSGQGIALVGTIRI